MTDDPLSSIHYPAVSAHWQTDGPPLKTPVAAQLMRTVLPMPESATCLEVLERFHEEAWLWAIPVIDDQDQPMALLDRHGFVEFLSRLYARDLFGRRSLKDLRGEHVEGFRVASPIIVDVATSLDDVAQIIMGEGMRHMVSGFIVTREQVYAGIVSGHDLNRPGFRGGCLV